MDEERGHLVIAVHARNVQHLGVKSDALKDNRKQLQYK
jgi:hypothetical protein